LNGTAATDDRQTAARPGFAARLAALGVTPNMISYAGAGCALAASAVLALAAGHALPGTAARPGIPTSWWPVLAGALLTVSALADMLDGAVARGGGLQTRFGALLDSTLDRFADMALFAGCAVYFAAAGNVTFVLICFVAATGAVQVSYVKARAENLTTGVGVGFWQRGERIVSLLVGAYTGHVASALCFIAAFSLFTVFRRVRAARRRLESADRTDPPSIAAYERVSDRYAPWRQRRSTVSYWAFCALIATAIVTSPLLLPFMNGLSDPLGRALAGLGG